MHVKILKESGLEEALLGLSLSFNKDPAEMYPVLLKLCDKDGGHNKALESICVWLDIKAPMDWWKQMDTYRIGVSKQSECYDSLTEVLTDSGWKLFKNVSMKDKLFSVNTETKVSSFQHPTKLFESYYDGGMVHITADDLNLCVTPNHRVLIKKEDGSYNFKMADDLLGGEVIPKKSIWIGEVVKDFVLPGVSKHWSTGFREVSFIKKERKFPMDLWLKFLGIYLSQGNINKNRRNYNIQITHNQYDGTAEEISNLLYELGFSFSVLREDKKNTYRWTISDLQLYTYLSQFGKSKTKFIPAEIKNLSSDQLEILLEWLNKGDGTKDKYHSGYILYSSSSKKLSEDVQELYIKLGKMSNLYIRRNGEFCCYTVNFLKREDFKIPSVVSRFNYKGMVYCASVPNGTLLVRRNGRTTWCGNSTMHTLGKRRLTQEDFEVPIQYRYLLYLNSCIDGNIPSVLLGKYLPQSFLQRRVLCTNYKALRHILKQRMHHKLPEWSIFCKALKDLEHYELLGVDK